MSFGASISLDTALTYPDRVGGLVTVAGPISGLDVENTAEEETLFSRYDSLVESKNVDALAQLDVRVWGDGPDTNAGRLPRPLIDQLYTWCREIQRREVDQVGGGALESASIAPPAAQRLHDLRISVAVGMSKYDVSSFTASMQHLHRHVSDSWSHVFETAHMVCLEAADDFTRWLEGWLEGWLAEKFL